MTELLEEQRESWGTRGGFVLAAVGSAVGLGNLWRFPYELYDHGGGAFLIPYIIAVFVIGVPMLILEFSLGHFTQRAAPEAFARSHKKLEFVGWWSIILGFVIVTFYAVILAYCFSFLWFSVKGIVTGGELPWAGEGLAGVENAKSFFNDTYLGRIDGPNLGQIRWNIFWPLVVTWVVMYLCIFRGVKLVGKIVWLTVPLPWLMLLILTVRGLTLEGSIEGLAYYLNPDWSELAKAATWRFAFGQAFFSLSLAFGGVMITYASFLHRKSDLNNNAAIIGLADFGTSFVAGLAVFATLGGMALVTRQAGHPVGVENVAEGGPSLAFVAFPYALAQLPYSAWFSFVFFFALVTLGIDSAFSITESVLAAIIDKTGWRRSIILPVISIIGLAIGIVYITQGGLNWLGVIGDYIDGTWGIAFLGLLECILLGWLWRVDVLRRHANERSDWKLGRWWDYLIRIFTPVILCSLFFWSLFDDLTREEGFLRAPDGSWILLNCVGLSVMILVAIAAVLVSCARGRSDVPRRDSSEVDLQVKGQSGGAAAFVLAAASTVLILVLFGFAVRGRHERLLLYASLPPSIVAIIISNHLLNRYNKSTMRASWLARWAGLLATIDTGGFIALSLVYSTSKESVHAAHPPQEQLSTVSYVILGAVSLLIICGLGWCFYRALSAANKDMEIQYPDQGDDEQRETTG
ncbi:MAG TPA: sodium-dependent transporter [Sedimentisphaerales bacterium]|nr:sodium-dependent transporter [Sedimentisphaerales bacterium]